MAKWGRVQFGGAGVMVTSIALGTVPSVWPELIKPHPYWVAAFVVIGIVMMVAPWFIPDKLPNTRLAINSVNVGGDNSGHQIVAHGDVYIGYIPSASDNKVQDHLIVRQEDKEKLLSLELTSHCDNDDAVYLEVKNHGDTVNVSAKLEIVGLSTGKKYKTWPFIGQWKNENATVDFYDPQPETVAGEIRIECNKSRLLKIASIASMAGLEEQEMALAGINESIVWNTDPRLKQELPYFSVRVTLIAKGYTKTKEETYKVGPKTTHGPFQMTEVPA
ncbi:MAG TPA: hypothetical protein VK574_20695 [Terracidiphilus sp.]|nr:hypothetical protein [Terracidiphilus sp.]